MKTNTSRPPTSLTVLGQSLVNELHYELQSGKAGKYSKTERPPITFHALDQPLVTSLWNQIKGR